MSIYSSYFLPQIDFFWHFGLWLKGQLRVDRRGGNGTQDMGSGVDSNQGPCSTNPGEPKHIPYVTHAPPIFP